MKLYSAIIFILLAPALMWLGIQGGGLIENDTLRLLTWCALIITLTILFFTASIKFSQR